MAANGHRSNNAALHQLSHALWIRTVCFREVQALHRPMQHADNVLLDTASNAVQVHAHQRLPPPTSQRVQRKIQGDGKLCKMFPFQCFVRSQHTNACAGHPPRTNPYLLQGEAANGCT
eukprot:scaffold350_cov333-Pavlova_lutheri.AAC.45